MTRPWLALVLAALALALVLALVLALALSACLSWPAGDEIQAAVVAAPDVACWNRKITSLRDDACYATPALHVDQCLAPEGSHFNHASLAFAPASSIVISPHAEPPLVVFIHVNKAAGETIKNFLFSALRDNQWDGVALGSRAGWPFRGAPWPALAPAQGGNRTFNWNHALAGDPIKAFNRGPAMYVQCGLRCSTEEQLLDYYMQGGELAGAAVCPVRLVWGNAALGLCAHFPGQPCVHVVSLRDPLERALSDWNYFCVEGAEGRKKWKKEWIARERCLASPVEWLRERRASPYFLVERLTRGSDAWCGVDVALHNLFHPCTRYLLTDRLDDGIERLAAALGPKYQGALNEYRDTKTARNVHAARQSNFDHAALSKLRFLLADDYRVYDAAVARYEAMWARPWHACS